MPIVSKEPHPAGLGWVRGVPRPVGPIWPVGRGGGAAWQAPGRRWHAFIPCQFDRRLRLLPEVAGLVDASGVAWFGQPPPVGTSPAAVALFQERLAERRLDLSPAVAQRILVSWEALAEARAELLLHQLEESGWVPPLLDVSGSPLPLQVPTVPGSWFRQGLFDQVRLRVLPEVAGRLDQAGMAWIGPLPPVRFTPAAIIQFRQLLAARGLGWPAPVFPAPRAVQHILLHWDALADARVEVLLRQLEDGGWMPPQASGDHPSPPPTLVQSDVPPPPPDGWVLPWLRQ